MLGNSRKPDDQLQCSVNLHSLFCFKSLTFELCFQQLSRPTSYVCSSNNELFTAVTLNNVDTTDNERPDYRRNLMSPHHKINNGEFITRSHSYKTNAGSWRR